MKIERIMNNAVSFLDKTNGRTPMHLLSAGDAERRTECFEHAIRRVAKAGMPTHLATRSTASLEADLLVLGGDDFDTVVAIAIELGRREYAYECEELSRDRAGDFDTVEA